MMTDPIADMLTRIRNAVTIERPFVDIPTSKMKTGIAGVLKREGYIWDFEVIEAQPRGTLRLTLKYGPNGERVLRNITRSSKPGRRLYRHSAAIPKVLQGLGISILSTDKGILSGREAQAQGLGGELLCTIW